MSGVAAASSGDRISMTTGVRVAKISARKVIATLALLAVWKTVLLCGAANPSAGAPRPSIAIEDVAVVDVVNGVVISPRTVVIVDGQITAITEDRDLPGSPATEHVDGRGGYLMPGLVDMHVHLFNNASHRPPNEWAFPLFVANGVTGVRDMLCEPTEMTTVGKWRAGATQGDLIAPRVLATGMATPGNSIGVVREQVREARRSGADFVKIFSEVREPNWRAILDEARALQLPVCGHIPADVSLLAAANAGQRSDEHLTQAYEACSAHEERFLAPRRGLQGEETVRLRDAQEPEVLETFDQLICDRTATALARTDMVQVPTLVLPYFEARGERANFRNDPRWRYLRPDEKARWERIFSHEYPVADEKLAGRRWEVSRQIVKTMHGAGVRILAGTDTPMPLVYPGFSLHKELELLVESGLSAADALRAATIWPAEFLGLSESSGSIAVGQRADLLLLDDNPLSDIRHTQRIRAVVLDGRLLQRGQLNALLDTRARDSSPAP